MIKQATRDQLSGHVPAPEYIGKRGLSGLALQRDDRALNETQFPPEPLTGLLYTPPGYSDHIPTCATPSTAAPIHIYKHSPQPSLTQTTRTQRTCFQTPFLRSMRLFWSRSLSSSAGK